MARVEAGQQSLEKSRVLRKLFPPSPPHQPFLLVFFQNFKKSMPMLPNIGNYNAFGQCTCIYLSLPWLHVYFLREV